MARPKKNVATEVVAEQIEKKSVQKKTGRQRKAPKLENSVMVNVEVLAKVREACEAKKLSDKTTKDAYSRVKALMAKYPEPPTDEQLLADVKVARPGNALWALRLWRTAISPQT